MHAILPVYYIIANAEATANHSNLDGIRFGMREDGESVEDVMINSRTKDYVLMFVSVLSSEVILYMKKIKKSIP